jgi:hypothetical protein
MMLFGVFCDIAGVEEAEETKWTMLYTTQDGGATDDRMTSWRRKRSQLRKIEYERRAQPLKHLVHSNSLMIERALSSRAEWAGGKWTSAWTQDAGHDITHTK